MAEVEGSPVVLDRYERHFSMGRASVLGYLQSLRYARLEKAGQYTVYSAPKSGVLRMHTQRLPQGEPIFEDSSGRPILRAVCGNPLSLGPTATRTHGLQPLAFLSPVEQQRPGAALEEFGEAQPDAMIAVPALPVDTPATVVPPTAVTLDVSPTPPVVAGPVAEVGQAPIQFSGAAAAGAGLPGYLAILPLAALLFDHNHGDTPGSGAGGAGGTGGTSGGGTGGTGGLGTTGGSGGHTPPVVPSPGAYLGFVAAAVAHSLRRKKVRRLGR